MLLRPLPTFPLLCIGPRRRPARREVNCDETMVPTGGAGRRGPLPVNVVQLMKRRHFRLQWRRPATPPYPITIAIFSQCANCLFEVTK